VTADIIDTINARTEARRSSDRELAHITGQTVAELDADTTQPDLRASERCCFNYFTRLRNINYERDRFHAYCQERGRADGTLQLWQWDSLYAMFDARDEAETVADARAAAHW